MHTNHNGETYGFLRQQQRVQQQVNLSGVVYVIICLSAALIYMLQRLAVPLPLIINNYANDLLCLPIVLGALAFGIRKLKKNGVFRFSLGFVLCMAGYYSFYFEYYLPDVDPRYTADWMDVAVYFAGGLLYFLYDWIFQDQTLNESSL